MQHVDVLEGLHLAPACGWPCSTCTAHTVIHNLSNSCSPHYMYNFLLSPAIGPSPAERGR